jgi:putative ABC transport system ATP-binding protein
MGAAALSSVARARACYLGPRMAKVVEAHGIVKRFRDGASVREPLSGVELSIDEGEIVCVMGRSGSGKSTLLGIVGGLDRDFEGSLSLFGRDAKRLSDRELSHLRGEKIGFVFQAYHLLSHLTVLDNVLAPSLFRAHDGVHEPKARALLERLGLGDRLHDRPPQLSGGQRQRVALARALLLEPALLVCDEPTGNLDGETARVIVSIFHELAERGVAVLLATHADRLSDASARTLRLEEGALRPSEAA